MLISVHNLVKRYRNLPALNHFKLEVGKGGIVGLLGPNGSGKTTAINCMLALLKYDQGEIKLFGKPMAPGAYDIKQNIGIDMQNVAVFNELRVEENIDYFCASISVPGPAPVNIACGIAHKPELFFFDEPTHFHPVGDCSSHPVGDLADQ